MTPSTSSRPVFITGAGSGIGRATAVTLSGLGHPVYAAARKTAHLEELGAIGNITPVRLDVRDPDQARAAVEMVAAAGAGLYALVNNAGVGGIGPIAAFTDDEVRDLFEVNVFGVVRMTRLFLPMLLEARGRVVIVGSQGGSISMKYYGPYTMTKHALESFVVALDAEIRPHGARATILQPGGVITDIGRNSAGADEARFRRAGPPFDVEAGEILSMPDGSEAFDPSRPESAANRNPTHPDVVADAVRDALDAADPALRVLIGTRWEGNRVLDALMSRIDDANACPSLRYPEEELLRRLEMVLRMKGGDQPERDASAPRT